MTFVKDNLTDYELDLFLDPDPDQYLVFDTGLDPCSGPLWGAPRACLVYVASMSEQGPRPMDDRLVKLVVEIQVG